MENLDKQFNQEDTVKRIAKYYKNGYEKSSDKKPDFYSFYHNKFICSICGHKYSWFHLFHRN